MSKKINLQLYRTSGSTQPQVSSLLHGELGIGYMDGSEKMFIKNTSNEIVEFSSDELIMASVEAKGYLTEDDAEIIAAALNDINDDIIDLSGNTETALGTINGRLNQVSGTTVSLDGKINQVSGVTTTLSNNLSSLSGDVVEIDSKSEILAAALNDINDDIIDLSGNTETALSEINNSISALTEDVNDCLTNEDGEVITTAFNDINGRLNQVSGTTATLATRIDNIDTSKCKSVTYNELVSLKTNSGLEPGMFYRITDYVTTTVQTNTQSAGNQFDIIVKADSINVLNENATAALHSGDTYFSTAGANLEAWELKYCLDNDTNRFTWADSTNGKGVIWWMKDDNDNECYYDFKNIKFKVGAKTKPGTVDNVYYYTFSVATGTNDSNVTDHSLNGIYCYKNSIGKYISSSKLKLSFNVFRNVNSSNNCYSNTFGDRCYSNTFGYNCSSNTFGDSCYSNTFGYNCYNNTFGDSCYSNTFGYNCSSNTFRDSCISNTFGSYCQSDTFGNNCYSNVFGSYCQSDTFGNNCDDNTFGDRCSSNTFGYTCESNTFENKCSSNTFGSDCSSNTFGSDCHYNTFGSDCSSNTFGNDCYSNIFGSDCSSDTFGNNCHYNTFGSYCSNITFGTSTTIKSYYKYIIIENGNKYIYLDCSATTSSSSYFQNVKIAQGVNNTNTYKTITHTTAGDIIQTIYKPANSVEISV